MIVVLQEKAESQQLHDMLKEYGYMIKIVVDIRRAILAGGGEMHADCEGVLLRTGSEQDDIWGANWFPEEQSIEFESLINIRPRLGNRSMIIQDTVIRQQVETIARKILGGVV